MNRFRHRPILEELENRTVPSTITWTGAGGDDYWDNTLNWDAHVLPGIGTVDDLR